MGVTTNLINKPFSPRGNDQSPLAYNRAKLYSGKALDFDGVNDFANVVYSDTIGSVWTWSSIIEADTLSGYQAVFGGTYGANNGLIVLSGSELNIYTNTDNSFSYTLETGKKYHVALSQSGSSVSAFINGVLVDSVSLSVTLDAGGGSYYIGRNPYSAIEFFNGKISGVKLFNTALTAAQVADLYNNPEKVVPTGVSNTALKLWLPMMEGAGTTAYDGSGNGNHGTISGATYVNGVGAPVSQSAVISWNKGVNLLTRSEEFLDADWVSQSSVTLTSGQDAPDGSTNAFKYNISAATSRAVDQTYSFGIASYTFAIYVKAIVDTTIRIRSYDGWSEDISINVADGWTRIDSTHTTSASSAANIGFFDASGSTGDRFYIWGASLEQASTAGPYVRTGATAQTSPVLLPQGLTSGRDITGVNLFENVRKQGALNLDGNSWAEVHDNGSLDMTTTATMEAWVNCDDLVAAYQIIMVKSSDTYWTGNYGRYVLRANEDNVNWWFNDFSLARKYYNVQLSGYNHLVVTKDGAEEKLYLNGALVATETGAATFTASPYSLVIGAQSSYAENWDNQLAQPRIYNRALTAEEVQRNYNAGKNIYK